MKINSLAVKTILLTSLCLQSAKTLADEENGCHPLSLTKCFLPFPSDTFKPDTIDFTMSEKTLSLLPERLKPSEILSIREGFSPSSPVLFEAPFKVNPKDLPINGGSVVKVFDLDSSSTSSIPVKVRLSMLTDIQSKKNKESGITNKEPQVIEVLPRSRFPFGHRLVAVLTTDLKSATGTVSHAVEIPEELAHLKDFLVNRGVSDKAVLSMTAFTIAKEDAISAPLLEMIEIVQNQDHPIRNIKTEYSKASPIGAHVTGEVLLTNFRTEDGTVLFSSQNQGKEYWTPFDLYLPHSARDGSVPIQIYGHGLTVDKTSAWLVSYANALKGVATIAIDQPNHGTRCISDGGYIIDIFRPENMGIPVGMAIQSVLDMHSLVKAIKTSIAKIDVLPANQNIITNKIWPEGYKKPDINSERIFYAGTSLGGVLGIGFLGTTKDIEGAYLQVAGAGILNTLGHSYLLDYLGFFNLIPEGASGAEAAVILSLVQHALDSGDGINYIHNIRKEGQITPLTIQYGVNDLLVYNDATLALAEIADLPLVSPVIKKVPYLRKSERLEDGFGLIQANSLLWVGGKIKDLWAHGSFWTLKAQKSYLEWLDTTILKK